MPLSALLLAAAAPGATLAPTAPWSVHATDELCRLERPYAAGKHEAALLFQPLLDLPTMDLYVTTQNHDSWQYKGDVAVAVQPGDRRFNGHYLSVPSQVAGARVTRLTVDRAALAALSDGDTLQVTAKPIDLTFAVDGMEQGRAALAVCEDQLKRAWGLDPAAEALIAIRAVPPKDLARLLQNNYAAATVRQGVIGRVVALLTIGVDGKVDRCRIVSTAGSALNESTCRTVLGLHFTPASDRDGKPLASTYLLPVQWTIGHR